MDLPPVIFAIMLEKLSDLLFQLMIGFHQFNDCLFKGIQQAECFFTLKMLKQVIHDLIVVVAYCLDLCRKGTELDDTVMESLIVLDYLHGSIEYFICEELRAGFLSGAFKKGEEPDVFF